MIRTVVGHESRLVRGALAFVLGAERDIEVVAGVGRFEDLGPLVRTHRPHVTVLDLDLLAWDGTPAMEVLHRICPGGAVLVLLEANRSRSFGPVLAGQLPNVGLLAMDGPPERLVTAVRSAARGEQVVDPELVAAALQADCPLTPREVQILGVAAAGVPVREIAVRLELAPGTVRNYLSRAMAKTGARTRIEAVRVAHDAGWI